MTMDADSFVLGYVLLSALVLFLWDGEPRR